MTVVKQIVHQFYLADLEDPQLYAAQGLHEWEISEQGKWVKENAIEIPTWNVSYDVSSFGYVVRVRATFEPQNYTYWKLKYS
jgi:hypothetical protein